MLSHPIDPPVRQRTLHLSFEPRILSIAILVLLCGSIFTASSSMISARQSELLAIAMLASLGYMRFDASRSTSRLAEDLLAFSMASLGTIAMLYLLA